MAKSISMIITPLVWSGHYKLTLCHVWMSLFTLPYPTVGLPVGGMDKLKSGIDVRQVFGITNSEEE